MSSGFDGILSTHLNEAGATVATTTKGGRHVPFAKLPAGKYTVMWFSEFAEEAEQTEDPMAERDHTSMSSR